MKLFIEIVAVLLIVDSAWSLKCYEGSDTNSTAKDCAANTVCAKITLESDKKEAYSCAADSSLMGTGVTKDNLNKTLDCKDDGSGDKKGSYCYCNADECNKPASKLMCHVGDTADAAKANQTCATHSGEDRCYTKTEKDVVMTKCFKSADIDAATMTDKDCKTEKEIKICLCDTDNCNNPSGAAGSATQSLVQIFAVIGFSSLLRLGLS